MMWWRISALLGVGMIVLVGSAGQLAPAGGIEPSAWQTDYPAAKAAARQSGKPIFVVFR